MAQLNAPSILCAAIIWCLAYALVAIISCLRAFTLICLCVSCR